MAIDGKSDDDIRRILTETRSIAMVGASSNPARASNAVLAFLIEHGYAMKPVNPGQAGDSILGAPAVASLADLAEPVDMIDVFRNSFGAGATVEEVLRLPWKPKVIWMQLGVVNKEAAAKAEAAGIEVVMDRCPKIEIARLGL
jgi:predicted CoA-binding protein